jgi:phage host-nuclease inhibitor protein Gam
LKAGRATVVVGASVAAEVDATVADAAVSPPLEPDDEHDETPKSATANTNAGRVKWLMDPPDDRLDRDINEANPL